MNKLWFGVGWLLLVVGLLFGFSRSGDVRVEYYSLDTVPVSLYIPHAPRAGVMIVAHGFAGSQPMMEPLALSLAHHGIPTLTFDFPGHGRNAEPFTSSVDPAGDRSRLLDAFSKVAGFAQQRFPDQPLFVAGHSMGSFVVVEYAAAHPEVAATVGISLVSDQVSPLVPRNLLILTGDLEFARLKDVAREALRNATDLPRPDASVTYGDPALGSGRRLEWIPFTEHISVLFADPMAAATLRWVDAAVADPQPITFVDRRMFWICFIIVGGLMILWQALGLIAPLQRLSSAQVGGWRRWVVELLPAFLTPVVLLPVSADWLPVLLAGYVAMFFAVYGLLQWCTARLLGVRLNPFKRFSQLHWRTWVLSLACFIWLMLVIGLPIHIGLMNLVPVAGRVLPIVVCVVCMAVFFILESDLQRGAWGLLGARSLFILSLLFNIVIRSDVGFLMLILPIFVLFFGLVGVVSTRLTKQTHVPIFSAFIASVIFGWFLGVALPYTG